MNAVQAPSPIAALDKAPSSEKELVTLHQNLWDYLKDSRQGLEYRIKEAQYFLEGNQWIRYLPHNQRFGAHNLKAWVPTPVTNLLIKSYDRILDILTSGPLHPIVDPASQDVEDVSSAKVAQNILRSEFIRQNTEGNIYIPTASWLIVAGTVFLSARWDAHAGATLNLPKHETKRHRPTTDQRFCPTCSFSAPANTVQGDTCPTCNTPGLSTRSVADLSQKMQTEQVRSRDDQGRAQFEQVTLGDVEERTISPLHLYPQPAQDWGTVQKHGYAMEVMPANVDWIKDIFGSKAVDVEAELLDIEELNGVPLPMQHPYPHADAQIERHMALVKFLRHAPTKKWPKGHFSISAAGQILHKGELDSPTGLLPYEQIKYRHLPGLFWGGSAFTDLLPMQKRVNAIDSHIVQNRKQNINPRYLIPVGAKTSPIDGRAGLEIKYDPVGARGAKPEQLPGMPLPAQVLQEREQMKQDMDEISGATQTLMGGVPSSGLETGASVEAVQEQAFRKFGPTVKLLRIGLAAHEKNKLLLIQKHWTELRLVRVLGDNSAVESFYYQGADILRGEDMHVRVSVGAAFSEAAKRQRIVELVPTGLFGNIEDPAVRGKLLERLDIEGFESEYVLDAKKARRVIQRILNNQEPPALLPIDNHAIQFNIIRDYLLTDEFEQITLTKQQQLFTRAMQHKEQMDQQNQQLLQNAQAAKGAPEQITQEMAQAGALQSGTVQTQQ